MYDELFTKTNKPDYLFKKAECLRNVNFYKEDAKEIFRNLLKRKDISDEIKDKINKYLGYRQEVYEPSFNSPNFVSSVEEAFSALSDYFNAKLHPITGNIELDSRIIFLQNNVRFKKYLSDSDTMLNTIDMVASKAKNYPNAIAITNNMKQEILTWQQLQKNVKSDKDFLNKQINSLLNNDKSVRKEKPSLPDKFQEIIDFELKNRESLLTDSIKKRFIDSEKNLIEFLKKVISENPNDISFLWDLVCGNIEDALKLSIGNLNQSKFKIPALYLASKLSEEKNKPEINLSFHQLLLDELNKNFSSIDFSSQDNIDEMPRYIFYPTPDISSQTHINPIKTELNELLNFLHEYAVRPKNDALQELTPLRLMLFNLLPPEKAKIHEEWLDTKCSFIMPKEKMASISSSLIESKDKTKLQDISTKIQNFNGKMTASDTALFQRESQIIPIVKYILGEIKDLPLPPIENQDKMKEEIEKEIESYKDEAKRDEFLSSALKSVMDNDTITSLKNDLDNKIKKWNDKKQRDNFLSDLKKDKNFLPIFDETSSNDWITLGNKYASINKSVAINCYNVSLSINKNDNIAWYNLGNRYSEIGRKDLATVYYHISLSFNKNNDYAWCNLGNRYKEIDLATVCYYISLAINKNNNIAWNSLGKGYSEIGRKDLSIVCYYISLAINKNCDTAWNNLGNRYSEIGRKDLSIVCYYISLAINKNYDTAWNNLGNRYSKIGRKDLSIVCYYISLAINKNYDVAWNNLGNRYYKIGRKDLAIATYQTALTIDPKNESYWNGLVSNFYERRVYRRRRFS
ncbi:MAG: tetratricopeptide repeat protein [Desulfobacterales bacterium]|nr:tetratricopeptide repeat protein [Desulfobacterales bacterium]